MAVHVHRTTQEGLAELPRPLGGVCLGWRLIRRAAEPRTTEAEVRCWSRVSEDGKVYNRLSSVCKLGSGMGWAAVNRMGFQVEASGVM